MTSLPSISTRKWYSEIPNEPSEYTSTIVLTSPQRYYVDVRIWKEPEHEDQTPEGEDLQWAFAGKSESSSPDKSGRYSSTWHHWVDSKPSWHIIDRGEMIPQDNGDVLERGEAYDPDTEMPIEYEELWTDLPLSSPDDVEDTRVCSVWLGSIDEEAMNILGMVIHIGSWCQGILKHNGSVTVERWQRSEKDSIENGTRWKRTFQTGKGELPCEGILESTIPREHWDHFRHGVWWTMVESSTCTKMLFSVVITTHLLILCTTASVLQLLSSTPNTSLTDLPNPYPLPNVPFLLDFHRQGDPLPASPPGQRPILFNCLLKVYNQLGERVIREGNAPIPNDWYDFFWRGEGWLFRDKCHVYLWSDSRDGTRGLGWNDTVSFLFLRKGLREKEMLGEREDDG
ncbi:MAG: hypothetical protein Q9219_006763 [cf. Caloplaca sp. 3 TL-2023]